MGSLHMDQPISDKTVQMLSLVQGSPPQPVSAPT